jgi:hypothetical protein
VTAVVMKNCEPLVFLPALAMERIPTLVCFNLKFSSIYPCEIRVTISQRVCERTCKLFAVDRFTARAVMAGKVAALEHESGNDTVEPGSCVTKAVLTCGELTEVLGRLWYDIVIELELDAASGFAVDFNVELNWVSDIYVRRREHSRRRSPWWIA